MAWRVFNGQRNWIYGYKDIALTNLKWGGGEFRKRHKHLEQYYMPNESYEIAEVSGIRLD